MFVCPLKSAQDIEVTRAQVSHRGLEHDRRFVLVDPEGNLVMAWQRAALLTVSTKIEPGPNSLDTAKNSCKF